MIIRLNGNAYIVERQIEEVKARTQRIKTKAEKMGNNGKQLDTLSGRT